MTIIASDALKDSLKPKPVSKHLVRLFTKRANLLSRRVNNGEDAFKIWDEFQFFVDDGLRKLDLAKATCKKGCSHCCYVSVALTGFEAKHIEARTGRPIVNFEPADMDRRRREPCVFLAGNECTIYDHRPVACRMFLSFDDVRFCEDEAASHLMMRLDMPDAGGFSFANVMYMHLVKAFYARDNSLGIIKDIRSYFVAEAGDSA